MKAELEVKITLDEVIQGLISKGDIDPIIAEIKDKAVTNFIHCLLNSPSSPVSADCASEISEWYDEAKASGIFDGDNHE